jgi:phage tail tape-measure protein
MMKNIVTLAFVLLFAGLPVAISADAGLAFHGRVYSQATGHAVWGAQVVVYNNSEIREVQTDRTGRFAVLGLTAAKYAVIVRHAKYADGCASVDVVPGESEYATIALPPPNAQPLGCSAAQRDGSSYIIHAGT